MDIKVKKNYDRNDEYLYTEARCVCGRWITTEVDDFECRCCRRTYNIFGQELKYPQGQSEDYAGEKWEDS